MDRKEIEGQEIRDRRRYRIYEVIMLTICGTLFAAIGIMLLTMEIQIFAEGSPFGYQYIIMNILILILFAASTCAFIFGWKDVHYCRKINIAKKRGADGLAVFLNSYEVFADRKQGFYRLKLYGFVLSYQIEGQEKTFKTKAIYDINEFNYLKSLGKVKIKIYKDFVAINEKFFPQIYQKDPVTGLMKSFFKKKPMSTVIKVGLTSVITSIILFLVLLVLSSVFKNNLFLIIGLVILLIVVVSYTIAYVYCVEKYKDK